MPLGTSLLETVREHGNEEYELGTDQESVDNARAFMQVEGIPPLIQFLGDESTRIKFFAAACTWVLAAYQDEFQNALLNAGAVPALLQLIGQDHEDIAWQAAGALRNIVLNNRKSSEYFVNMS
jgi:hypothetical protein